MDHRARLSQPRPATTEEILKVLPYIFQFIYLIPYCGPYPVSSWVMFRKNWIFTTWLWYEYDLLGSVFLLKILRLFTYPHVNLIRFYGLTLTRGRWF